MDTYEAIRLLGLEAFLGVDDDDKSHFQKYTKKDVEKCFRQQALKHHPDKGGDPGKFQRLHKAKDILLDDDYEHHPFCNPSHNSSYSHTNSTAVSTSLYQHRTCIRQVLVVGTAVVVAATDDGLVVMEGNRDAPGDSGLERVLSFTTTDSFLCCAKDSHNNKARRLYAGAKDGVVHTIHWSTTHAMEMTHGSWQLPTRERIVAISAVGNWVGMATAQGGIYVYDCCHQHERDENEDEDNSCSASAWNTPTLVWKWPPREKPKTAWDNKNNMIPETISLEEGSSSSNSLRIWVGGSSGSDSDNDASTGRLILWELDTQDDLLEECSCGGDNEMEYGLWDDSDSDTDSSDASDDSEEERNSSVPVVDVTVEEGPVFALAKHKRTVAVASGSSVLVWDCIEDTSNNSNCNSRSNSNRRTQLVPSTTLHTPDQTLYTVCLHHTFLAAAGSGEAIRVWDAQAPWTLLHYLALPRHPAGCCLATNCILTLDWWDEDSARLVSGGYDGVVTVWTLAHRLEEGDADENHPIDHSNH